MSEEETKLELGEMGNTLRRKKSRLALLELMPLVLR